LQLVDGGWVERVPVLAGRDMGADIVIAVDVSSEIVEFEDKSGLDIVLRADAVTRVYLNELLIRDADVAIHPDVGRTHWADFSDPKKLFKQGEVAAREKVMSIKAAIYRTVAPQKTLVDQIKTIRDKIVEKVTGGKQ
jgi:NTE family protein